MCVCRICQTTYSYYSHVTLSFKDRQGAPVDLGVPPSCDETERRLSKAAWEVGVVFPLRPVRAGQPGTTPHRTCARS